MRKPLLILLALTVPAVAAHAGLRNSMNYAITTDTTDLGGVLTTNSGTSPIYTNVGGVETFAGMSSVVSPAEIGREGYVGQLTELASFSAATSATSIAQNTTCQLSGTAQLTDGTTSVLSGSSIAWTPVMYPFTSISKSGVLTAASVYNAPAGTVTGSYLGAQSTLTIQVTGGEYVGGEIPDAWLFEYFGPAPNALASPLADADGTGQTNLFKYLAGLNPTDGSRFVLTIAPVTGQPNEKALTLTPVYSGRTYTPLYSATLVAPSWQPLTNMSTSDNGTTSTVTDLNAGSGPRFYQVQISMP